MPDAPSFCPRCGTPLAPDAAFCGGCGAKTSRAAPAPVAPAPAAAPAPHQAPAAASQPHQASASIGAPQTKSPWPLLLAIFIPLLVLLAGGAGLYLWLSGGGGNRELLLTKRVEPSTERQTIKAGAEVEVRVPFNLLEKPAKLSVARLSGLRAPDGKGKLARAYEVKLGELQQLKTVLEIEVKHPAAKERAPRCLASGPGGKHWRAVACRPNPERGTITFFTKHLSIFTAERPKPPEPGPMMKLGYTRYPSGQFLRGDAAARLLERRELKQGALLGWRQAMEWYGVAGAGSALGEHLLQIGPLKAVNKVMSEMGLAFAFAQAAIDFAEGKRKAGVLNLVKNLYNYGALKVVDTRALNLAFVGVFMLDYALNKFADKALSGRKKLYQKAYKLYYQERHGKKKTPYWYRRLRKLMRKARPGEDIGTLIDAELKEHVREFWADHTVVYAYLDRVMKRTAFSGGGGLHDNVERDISRVQLAELRQRLEPALDQLARETRMHYQAEAYKILEKGQAALNQQHTIKVVVSAKQGGEQKEGEASSKIDGLKVMIPVRDERQREQWKGETDKEGVWQLRCTTLGYIVAGAPKKVQLLLPPKAKGEEPKKLEARLRLKASGKTVVKIELGEVGFSGQWRISEVTTEYMSSGKIIPPLRGKRSVHTFTHYIHFDRPNLWTRGKEGEYITFATPKWPAFGYKYWIKVQGPDSFTGRYMHRYGGDCYSKYRIVKATRLMRRPGVKIRAK